MEQLPLPSAAIYGCSGISLTEDEQSFFKQHNPLGLILFSRNIETPEQTKALIEQFKSTILHDSPLILIDQEGGRVARLKPPHWPDYPSAGTFAQLAKENLAQAKQATYDNYACIAQDLTNLGINVDCAPSLDLLIPDADDIIGDRALGEKPEQVTVLAKEICRALMDHGVLPVIKHIPGHGRADVDSHLSLPVVHESLDILSTTDFVPFRELNNTTLAMTAHITYTDIDPQYCATLSPKVINIIRQDIGFSGLLMTDDLSMKALSGSFAERTTQALEAGCDIILHCNGKMEEMQEIASVTPIIPQASWNTAKKALGTR